MTTAREMRQLALDCQPSTAENPYESSYEKGRFDGIMLFANAIRKIPIEDEPAIPVAWMRGVYQPSSVNGPAEHNVDMVYGEDAPDSDDDWVPLYRAPQPALTTEPAVAVSATLDLREELIEVLRPSRSPMTKATDPAETVSATDQTSGVFKIAVELAPIELAIQRVAELGRIVHQARNKMDDARIRKEDAEKKYIEARSKFYEVHGQLVQACEELKNC